MMVLGFSALMSAQSVDELKAMKSDKEAQLGALQGEVDALTKQIAEFPGWKIGGAGIAGFNALSNNNWYALGTPNSANSGLNIGLTGFANNDQDKYFWRNLLNITLARSAAFTDKDNDATKTVALANGLDLSSLFGYKLNDKWAASAEGKWTSSLVEFAPNGDGILDDEYKFSLNTPGQVTVSAGLTWTPISNLVVLIHPIGYQLNLPGDLISAAGAKIGASYAAEIIPGVSWTSNLSAFIPYTGAGEAKHMNADDLLLRTINYDTGDLVTWEWLNGFSTSLWKGIGLAFNIGLKQNKQQADTGKLVVGETALREANAGISDSDVIENLLGTDVSDNPFQSYYTLGLSYTF